MKPGVVDLRTVGELEGGDRQRERQLDEEVVGNPTGDVEMREARRPANGLVVGDFHQRPRECKMGKMLEPAHQAKQLAEVEHFQNQREVEDLEVETVFQR